MNKDNTIQSAGPNRKIHTVLSTLTIVIGVVLMIFMVTVESEPGAIPLLLVVVGVGWRLIARVRIRSHQR